MDKTIVKGMQVLEALVAAPEPMGVSELARQVGLTKSNVHRYLQTFIALGYATSANSRYAATLKIWQQGAKVIERLDLRRSIRPIMDQLARATLENRPSRHLGRRRRDLYRQVGGRAFGPRLFGDRGACADSLLGDRQGLPRLSSDRPARNARASPARLYAAQRSSIPMR